MSVLKRLKCLVGRHSRSQRQVRDSPIGYTSKCRYCGVPLKRDRDRVWRVIRE